jgi:hypothetical protein
MKVDKPNIQCQTHGQIIRELAGGLDDNVGRWPSSTAEGACQRARLQDGRQGSEDKGSTSTLVIDCTPSSSRPKMFGQDFTEIKTPRIVPSNTI